MIPGTTTTVPVKLLKACDKNPAGYFELFFELQDENTTPVQAYERIETARERIGLRRRYSSYTIFRIALRKYYKRK